MEKLKFNEEARSELMAGIEKLYRAVSSTMGVHGNTVLLESPTQTGGMTVTKDGVTVANAINLSDPVEALGVRVVREAAQRTALSAGDGTTTAIVLAYALLSAMGDGVKNRTEYLRELERLAGEVEQLLRKMARPVTELLSVATISANNDAELGATIAEVYEQVGVDGVVTVERSQTGETYYETTHGIKFDRGYSSPLFINDSKKDQCVYEDCHVLVSDAQIDSILQIEGVLRDIINKRERLLIIAPCSTQVINTIAANVMKNSVTIANVAPPEFGWRQHELMQDIALTIGATYFSEKTGDDLSLIQPSDLGFAKRVVIDRHSTIIKSEGKSEAVEQRISELREALKDKSLTKENMAFIQKRIATLAGGIGIIYVGGHTEMEMKERYDRVEDAVLAVRSALEDGILPGGGVALYYLSNKISGSGDSSEQMAALLTLEKALRAPLEIMYENADREIDTKVGTTPTYGVDLKTGEKGDLIEMGVIDPAKVTIMALRNAVSVAKTIMGTNCVVTLER